MENVYDWNCLDCGKGMTDEQAVAADNGDMVCTGCDEGRE